MMLFHVHAYARVFVRTCVCLRMCVCVCACVPVQVSGGQKRMLEALEQELQTPVNPQAQELGTAVLCNNNKWSSPSTVCLCVILIYCGLHITR